FRPRIARRWRPCEVAAVRDRVDVRAEEHGFERRVATGARCEDVAGGIDAHRGAGASHQVHDVLASCDVGGGGARGGSRAYAVRKRADEAPTIDHPVSLHCRSRVATLQPLEIRMTPSSPSTFGPWVQTSRSEDHTA